MATGQVFPCIQSSCGAETRFDPSGHAGALGLRVAAARNAGAAMIGR